MDKRMRLWEKIQIRKSLKHEKDLTQSILIDSENLKMSHKFYKKERRTPWQKDK